MLTGSMVTRIAPKAHSHIYRNYPFSAGVRILPSRD